MYFSHHTKHVHFFETEISQKWSKGIKNWKITYSVILNVLSNKTNLILGFTSPLKQFILEWFSFFISDSWVWWMSVWCACQWFCVLLTNWWARGKTRLDYYAWSCKGKIFLALLIFLQGGKFEGCALKVDLQHVVFMNWFVLVLCMAANLLKNYGNRWTLCIIAYVIKVTEL